VRAIGAGARIDPLALGGLRQVHVARDRADGLPSSITRWTTPALNSSVNWRRGRRLGIGHRSGHRIPHRKDAHRFGSSPPVHLRRHADAMSCDEELPFYSVTIAREKRRATARGAAPERKREPRHLVCELRFHARVTAGR
jgi:hypothetical protein